MPPTDTLPVLVGIDAEPDVDAVLELAAAEAVRRSCAVHLVHAVPPPSPSADPVAADTLACQRTFAGTEALVNAARNLEDLLGGAQPVTTELAHEEPVAALVNRSRDACLVLLLRRPRLLRRPPDGVVKGVASRALVPVVVVPSTWRRYRQHQPVISVGVEDYDTSAPVVRAALEVARFRRAGLRMVHAWRPGDIGHDDPEAGTWSEFDHDARLTKELLHDFGPLVSEYPDVRADLVISHDRPDEALVEEGDTVSLVVVGRHRPPAGAARHIGPIARVLLREAPCPVMVVEPHTAPRTLTAPAR